MRQNNLIQALLLTFITVVTAALAISTYIPTTVANKMTGTYTNNARAIYIDTPTLTWKEYIESSTVTWKLHVENTTVTWKEYIENSTVTWKLHVENTTVTWKEYIENSTITWKEISYNTITYTNTSTFVQTFTSHKIVFKPTMVIEVETSEFEDARGRVSTVQYYVPKRVILPVTETYEIVETHKIEVIEDTTITTSKTFFETKYLTFIAVEPFKPETEEGANNYLVFFMITLAVGLVAVITLARYSRKRAHVKGVCGGG